ncbi:UbiD family decarboxylase domain-containing protein [Enterobacter mori]|uniref:UbiD family decarboxylase domain-containing protein n=1 Tax=Enterobacter TaxID=547 RepID=UPI0012DA7976
MVDPTQEVAANIRRVDEEELPAPLFHNLVDAMPGARILGLLARMLSSKHLAYSRLALRFELS